MRSKNAFRHILIFGSVITMAIAGPRLHAQTPDYSDGGILVEPSLKTAAEFNRKAVRALDKPTDIERGEIPLYELLKDITRQTGLEIDVCRHLFHDANDLDVSKVKIKFSTKIVGVSANTALRLVCDQIDGAVWMAGNQVYLVPCGRPLNKLIEDTIAAHQPVNAILLESYVNEKRERDAEKNQTARMVRLLAAPIDVNEMKKPLKDVIAHFRKQYKINIVVDPCVEVNSLDAAIDLPELQGVRLDRALGIVLQQVKGLGYRASADCVTISKSDGPKEDIAHLACDFVPLHAAISELTEQTGKTIVLKLSEKERRKPVSIECLNESFETALKLLALQVGADVGRVDKSYVLTKKECAPPPTAETKKVSERR